MYGKWCFDLHVECCRSCMVSTKGVGVGKFLGCEGFLPEFSQTCPKRFGRLCLQIFSLKDHEDLFWDDLQKVFMRFSANFRRRLMKSNKVGSHFFPVFRGFAQIFKDFARIFNKSKLFALTPRLLHHRLAQNFRHSSTRVWLHPQWRLGVFSE